MQAYMPLPQKACTIAQNENVTFNLFIAIIYLNLYIDCLNKWLPNSFHSSVLLCCLSFTCVGNLVIDVEIVKVRIAAWRFSSVIEQPKAIPHEVW